jgi:hypothetical protein
MCACKETDVRGSANDCTLASGEGHGSCGETCRANFDKSPVSSLLVRPVYCCVRLVSVGIYLLSRYLATHVPSRDRCIATVLHVTIT